MLKLLTTAVNMILGPVLYKILSKSISITNYKIHFRKCFNYFYKWPKIQNTFTKSNWNTKYIQESLRECESISQL